jgi:hypothetical protein
MRAERQRLARLYRLERVRAIARQTAATAAAEAEGTLAQLEALAARTGRLAADYAARSDARDGMALQQLGRFSDGLQGISASTIADALRARTVADTRQAELASAERRRAAVEERATREAQGIAARAQQPALGTRRGFGTGLE